MAHNDFEIWNSYNKRFQNTKLATTQAISNFETFEDGKCLSYYMENRKLRPLYVLSTDGAIQAPRTLTMPAFPPSYGDAYLLCVCRGHYWMLYRYVGRLGKVKCFGDGED